MPPKWGHNLQISLGKTRSAPICLHGLMTSHVAVKGLYNSILKVNGAPVKYPKQFIMNYTLFYKKTVILLEPQFS